MDVIYKNRIATYLIVSNPVYYRKRLGLHNKSLITAPNGLTEQWGNAFRTLYPNANVLVATEKDFQKENRRDLFAKIATGDWDAVIIGHSQFDMIHLSRLQSLTADIKEAEIAAEAEFPQEKELIEKEKRLAEVNTLLTNSEVRIDNSMELYAALVDICPELESYDTLYCKYEKGEDSGIEPLIVEKDGDTVFIAHTYVQNGDLMYDPAIEFSFDTENHRAEALSYELSGMGIY